MIIKLLWLIQFTCKGSYFRFAAYVYTPILRRSMSSVGLWSKKTSHNICDMTLPIDFVLFSN